MFVVRKKSDANLRSYRSIGLVILMLLATVSFIAHPVLQTVAAAGEERRASPAVVFSNPAAITINAVNTATPYPSNITVAGVTGTVSKVTVTLTGLGHTYPEDIGALLVGPTGAKIRLMTDVGGGTGGAGGGAITGVNLTFDDAAANFLPDGGAGSPLITSGSYKPTQGTITGGGQGPLHPANFPAPAPANPYALTLSGLNGLNPNGTWSLYINDDAAGDAGAITGGWSIDITTAAPPVDFQDPNVDFNNDGRSDYILIRDPNAPLAANGKLPNPRDVVRSVKNRKNGKSPVANAVGGASPLTWYASYQGTATEYQLSWGDGATDDFAPFDFDGDGEDDFGVWRPGVQGEAAFHWVTSNDWLFGSALFGQTGDDTSVSGDYDGDGKDDLAVFRCPISVPGQCGFFYKPTLNNPTNEVAYISWGFGTGEDFYVYPGDFDGDGKNDFCVQTVLPSNPSQGTFLLLRSSDYQAEYIAWGLPNDVLVPGDYDGDGKSDFAVQREVSGGQLWTYIYERDGGIQYIPWGIADLDLPAPGDYDGDGKQDVGVYRWDESLGYGVFWVYKANGQVEIKPFGLPGDYPAALWYVH